MDVVALLAGLVGLVLASRLVVQASSSLGARMAALRSQTSFPPSIFNSAICRKESF